MEEKQFPDSIETFEFQGIKEKRAIDYAIYRDNDASTGFHIYPTTHYEIECPICETEFSAPSRKTVVCSEDCHHEWQARRVAEETVDIDVDDYITPTSRFKLVLFDGLGADTCSRRHTGTNQSIDDALQRARVAIDLGVKEVIDEHGEFAYGDALHALTYQAKNGGDDIVGVHEIAGLADDDQTFADSKQQVAYCDDEVSFSAEHELFRDYAIIPRHNPELAEKTEPDQSIIWYTPAYTDEDGQYHQRKNIYQQHGCEGLRTSADGVTEVGELILRVFHELEATLTVFGEKDAWEDMERWIMQLHEEHDYHPDLWVSKGIVAEARCRGDLPAESK